MTNLRPRAAVVVLVSLAAGGPAVAQSAEGSSRSQSGLAIFLTWLPMLVFLAVGLLMYRYLKRAGDRIQRAEQHMDRVEQLLERLVNVAERDDRKA